MKKPYGRKTKQKVRKILSEDTREKAFTMLEDIPDEQLVGHLFSHFYHTDELVKFRSIAAMGALTGRLCNKNIERARIVLRRIMWNLNDESGGIGWGSPEAMGEILFQSRALALEFKSILFSYLEPDGNYIEHEILQRGVLWGIGTYLQAAREPLPQKTESLLFSHLHSEDHIKTAWAVRALVNAGRFDCSLVPEAILSDATPVSVFEGWHFTETSISDMTHTCVDKRFFA
jgi:hypothetical protein